MAHNEALKEKKDRPQDREITDRVTFPITDNPALPNIQDILRKKKPVLHFTERLIKKHLQRSTSRRFPPFTKLSWSTRSFKTQKHRQDI